MVFDERGRLLFHCMTLERAYLDNERMISAVPCGTYPIVQEYSPRFDALLWELKRVPNRSEVKIHVANYWNQPNGCIALGDMHLNIDNDSVLDVRNSRKTLERFHEAMSDSVSAVIEIIDSSDLI